MKLGLYSKKKEEAITYWVNLLGVAFYFYFNYDDNLVELLSFEKK